MSFANCQMGGMNMASPDVCKTPSPPGSPVPIPYPNIAQGATANPGTAVQKVLISGAPAHTIQTIIPMSNGDEAGVVGGVVSSMNMGPCRHLMGASNVLIGGMPATKMGDQTGQNGMSLNVSGSTIAPAQTKVMIMSGGSGSGGSGASQSQASSSESKKPEKITLTNLRWEHLDENAKKETPDQALYGDMIILKVDVSGVPEGTQVMFRIYNASKTSAERFDLVYGPVSSGTGKAKWKVHVPRTGETMEPIVEFDAKVKNVISDRAEIRLGTQFMFSI